jgi:acyl-CoA thioester hydrolase
MAAVSYNICREPPGLLAEFPVVIEQPVQWGEQDAFGHVNNTVHFRWFETSRVAYLERLGMEYMTSPEGKGLILAAINCNYRRQIKYPDSVLIGCRVTRIGNASLTLANAVYSRQGEAIAAEGESVIVMFDYAKQKSRRVPEDLREAVARLEGREFA